MAEKNDSKKMFTLSEKNKFILVIIACFVPAFYFILVFLYLSLYTPALVCFLIFALFFIFYRRPLQKHKYNTVFCGVLLYAYFFEITAGYYVEWEMGFQNLLFVLIPLSFTFLYMDDNYDRIIPQGIRYSALVALCYPICSIIDYLVAPISGATHLEIRTINGLTSLLIILMMFSYIIIFVIELHSVHRKLMTETKARLNDMHSTMMLSQIKPHFLYNTIGAIEEMIDTDSNRAKRELEVFAQYMRINIDTLSSNDLVSFDKELSHVKSYVQIQNLRFGDTIFMEYQIAETNFKLPPLTIQPIIENAIKHGLRPKGGKGTIRISECEDTDAYNIKVTDDGVGFDMDTPKKNRKSTGLMNINYRLKNLCDGRVEMTSKPGNGTTVTVIIPKSNK